MAIVRSLSLGSQVLAIVTCPICFELFDNAKSLQCLHSFCLGCIEAYCIDHEPGDEVACPVCRKDFKIPDIGVRGLVSNFFIANLVEAWKIARSKAVTEPNCDLCSAENSRDDGYVAASTMYCVDCNRMPCEKCSRPHQRMKEGPHSVVPITERAEQLIQNNTADAMCDKHHGECADLVCSTCNMNICAICFAEEHKQDQCQNAEAVADEHVKHVDEYLETLRKRADIARNAINCLEDERSKFQEGIWDVRDKIEESREELRKCIDEQADELILEVELLETEISEEIDSHKENAEADVLAFETFNAYWNGMKATGEPCDLARAAATDLHNIVNELVPTDFMLSDYRAPEFTFIPMNIQELIAGDRNFIGRVSRTEYTETTSSIPFVPPPDESAQLTRSAAEAERCLEQPQSQSTDDVVTRTEMASELFEPAVVHTLSGAQTIYGVTSLDDELFVLRFKPEDQIEVYNKAASSYSLIRHLSVPGLKSFVDMTSCKKFRCLYIADRSTLCVHRVEMTGKSTNWSVSYDPNGLSMTSQFTVLVTCDKVGRVLEFTTNGLLLRELCLQFENANPSHTIQLSDNQFVLCHGHSGDPLNRVCIVDDYGRLIRSYGGPPGELTVGQLDVPFHLAVDNDGSIFVVDCDNRRVLLLSPGLTYVGVAVSCDQLNGKPWRLFLDAEKRRLYVAVDERVIVVQL